VGQQSHRRSFVAAVFFVSNAQADDLQGECNSIIAEALGSAQICYNHGCDPGDAECYDVGMALLQFFSNQECADAYFNGELKGLAGSASFQPGGPNAGGTKHITDVICGAIEECGLCGLCAAAQAAGICVGEYCQ
jgi:hypothetical protein